MRTVLIVDENTDIRKSISLGFSNRVEYRVVTASSRVDAILKANEIKTVFDCTAQYSSTCNYYIYP